jgi:hypothetical protein
MAPAPKTARDRPGDRPFYRGTPAVQQDVRDLFARVRDLPAREWNGVASELISYGEPAVPQMIANLDSEILDVQVMSAYCLGMIGDPRALPALSRASASPKEKLRYEAATAMLRLGDRRGFPIMIDGLADRDPLVRARAILVLKDRTGQTFGYKADDKPADRAAAVARWRAWLARTTPAAPPAGPSGG